MCNFKNLLLYKLRHYFIYLDFYTYKYKKIAFAMGWYSLLLITLLETGSLAC